VKRLATLAVGKRVATLAVVVVAALGGAVLALAVYGSEEELAVGTVRVSTAPGHRGALDLYVPLVDWGVRFPVVRMPARLRVELRTVDRGAVERVAAGEEVRVEAVRKEARDAIAAYIRRLVAVVFVAALLLGALVSLALRGLFHFPVGAPIGVAGGTALVCALMVVLLLPPRGAVDDPEYYAHGPDIPRALEAIETASDSAETLSEELDTQLVGLARLVVRPGDRPPVGRLPRITLASDVHNNFLALPALERAAGGGPVVLAGDLTDSGSPLEVRLVRSVVGSGDPLVMVSGNHDSDTLLRRLAREGAIVLTQRGRLLPDGRLGEVVVRVGGLRMAGYSDPFQRRRAERYRAGEDPEPTEGQQRAFADWLRGLRGRVDVVVVHAPALAERALDEMRDDPPRQSLAILVGHTHEQDIGLSENLVVLNGGTLGGGGAANVDDDDPLGLAVLTYETTGGFRPLAADLVELDPATGSSKAQRRRLDQAVR
jgi:predicted phosphodiesterase